MSDLGAAVGCLVWGVVLFIGFIVLTRWDAINAAVDRVLVP